MGTQSGTWGIPTPAAVDSDASLEVVFGKCLTDLASRRSDQFQINWGL